MTRPLRELRALVACLLLLGQMLSLAMAAPADARATGLDGVAFVICHADGGDHGHNDAPANRGHDCALCPACIGAIVPVLPEPIPTIAIEVPSAGAYPVRWPDPTGPPSRDGRVPPPRGPPSTT